MRQHTTTITILLIVVVIVIGWVVVTRGGGFEDNGTTQPDERNDVYNLTFTDYNGNTVALGDLTADVLVVNTWATWCPFCVDELPDFAELQEEFADESVVVIAINRGERLEQARDYTDRLEVSNNIVFLQDESDSFYKAIGGFSMPETIILNNKTGEILQHKRGPMELSEMKSRVERALNAVTSNVVTTKE